MTEIPEHLLKRAQAARDQSAAEPDEPSTPEPEAASDSRIPEHLLKRSSAAKAAKASGEAGDAEAAPGGAVAVADKVGAVVTETPAASGVPLGAGPGGHTQRLLTVVKSGSIQNVKATPIDKVHTWPHLLAAEFVAAPSPSSSRYSCMRLCCSWRTRIRLQTLRRRRGTSSVFRNY